MRERLLASRASVRLAALCTVGAALASSEHDGIGDDVAGHLRDGTTYVPLRAIAEWLGCTVSYSVGKLGVEREGQQVRLTVGSKTATRGDETIELSGAPYLYGEVVSKPHE